MSHINPIDIIVLYFYKMRYSIVIFTHGVRTHKEAFAFGFSFIILYKFLIILYKSPFLQANYMPHNLYF